MSFFQQGCYTQALAMVVSWGKMGRRSRDIYGPKDSYGETITQIENTLRHCAERIQESHSIEDSWNELISMENMHWSAVITSKTLHFLCRSLGFEKNPPVPIDNLVIRSKLWPDFRKSITRAPPPKNWQGNSFEAYRRYMTAILTWATIKEWTTTNVETTIFASFYDFK